MIHGWSRPVTSINREYPRLLDYFSGISRAISVPDIIVIYMIVLFWLRRFAIGKLKYALIISILIR